MTYWTLFISQLMRERNDVKLLKVHEKYSIPNEWATDVIELNIILEEGNTIDPVYSKAK